MGREARTSEYLSGTALVVDGGFLRRVHHEPEP
jgi:hypothetical protein